MPVLSRVVFLVLQAALLVLIGCCLTAPLLVLATPLPLPVPLMPHIADYAARIPVKNYTAEIQDPVLNTTSAVRRGTASAAVSQPLTSISSYARRQETSLTALLASATTLDLLASQAPTSDDDPMYQTRAYNAVTAYKTDLLGLRTLLGDQGKGLAYYNPNDPLQVTLKVIINANKDALNDIYHMIDDIPGLGPLLGPVVYDVKCVLDEILDFVENVTDELLNMLVPDLHVVIALAASIMVVPT